MMVNVYTQFVGLIHGVTVPEWAWLLRHGQKCTYDDALRNATMPPPPLALWDHYAEGCEFGFGLTLTPDKLSVFVEADESGVPEQVGVLMQAFLEKFRPSEVWSMTYAITCDRTIYGCHSGGAVVAWAGGWEIIDAFELAKKRSEEIRTESAPVMSETT